MAIDFKGVAHLDLSIRFSPSGFYNLMFNALTLIILNFCGVVELIVAGIALTALGGVELAFPNLVEQNDRETRHISNYLLSLLPLLVQLVCLVRRFLGLQPLQEPSVLNFDALKLPLTVLQIQAVLVVAFRGVRRCRKILLFRLWADLAVQHDIADLAEQNAVLPLNLSVLVLG